VAAVFIVSMLNTARVFASVLSMGMPVKPMD
jgi:hypothetical protein